MILHSFGLRSAATLGLVACLFAIQPASASITASGGDVTLAFLNDLGTAGHTNFDTTANIGTPPTYQVYLEQTLTLNGMSAGVVNTNANPAVFLPAAAPLATAGQSVTSYFFHMDNGNTSSAGTVTFDSPILAVFSGNGHPSSGGLFALDTTDAVFGLPSVTMYGQTNNPTFRGSLEQTTESISVSGNTITWEGLNGGANGLEQFRVLVAGPAEEIVPEPTTLAVWSLGLCLSGFVASRRRS